MIASGEYQRKLPSRKQVLFTLLKNQFRLKNKVQTFSNSKHTVCQCSLLNRSITASHFFLFSLFPKCLSHGLSTTWLMIIDPFSSKGTPLLLQQQRSTHFTLHWWRGIPHTPFFKWIAFRQFLLTCSTYFLFFALFVCRSSRSSAALHCIVQCTVLCSLIVFQI